MMMNKKIMIKSKRGFTMVEMAIVLIMIGILTASLAPLILRQHTNSQEGIDHQALLDAQTAVINYAITFGGIPDPVLVNGASTVPNVSAFGVNNWGAFGDGTTNPFRLDVNSTLTSSNILTAIGGTASSVGGERVTFCQAVNAAMSSVTAQYPQVCSDYTTNHLGVATACTTAAPVAFVLYSTGNNRVADQGNALTGRIYENDKRGINNSTSTTDLYDDQVMSYPLTALARDCREKMGVAPEVMSCPAGQKYVGSLTNNYTAATNGASYGYAPPPTSPVPANFTLYINSCQARTTPLWVNPDYANSASAVQVGGLSATLKDLDMNNDGRVDIFINALGVVTAQ